MSRYLRAEAGHKTIRKAPTVLSEPLRVSWRSGFMILDPRGIVRMCNDVVEKLFRCHRKQLLGRPVRKLIPALPLRLATPGYNLAYLSFWFPPGVLRRCESEVRRDSPAESFFLSAEVMCLSGKHVILLELLPVAGVTRTVVRPRAFGPKWREAAPLAAGPRPHLPLL